MLKCFVASSNESCHMLADGKTSEIAGESLENKCID